MTASSRYFSSRTVERAESWRWCDASSEAASHRHEGTSPRKEKVQVQPVQSRLDTSPLHSLVGIRVQRSERSEAWIGGDGRESPPFQGGDAPLADLSCALFLTVTGRFEPKTTRTLGTNRPKAGYEWTGYQKTVKLSGFRSSLRSLFTGFTARIALFPILRSSPAILEDDKMTARSLTEHFQFTR